MHCSAGIGRSGTFCLVDSCLVIVSIFGLNIIFVTEVFHSFCFVKVAKEGPENVSIKDILMELRSYRMGLIQTPEQLKFSYMAIAEGARLGGYISSEVLSEIYNASNNSGRTKDGFVIDESDDEGGPPPLPPPRSDSLSKESVVRMYHIKEHFICMLKEEISSFYSRYSNNVKIFFRVTALEAIPSLRFLIV